MATLPDEVAIYPYRLGFEAQLSAVCDTRQDRRKGKKKKRE